MSCSVLTFSLGVKYGACVPEEGSPAVRTTGRPAHSARLPLWNSRLREVAWSKGWSRLSWGYLAPGILPCHLSQRMSDIWI